MKQLTLILFTLLIFSSCSMHEDHNDQSSNRLPGSIEETKSIPYKEQCMDEWHCVKIKNNL